MILNIKYNLLAGGQSLDSSLVALKDLIFAEVIDGLSFADILKVLLSVMAGKTSIAGSTVTFRNNEDTLDRVVATMTDSERTAITINNV